MRRKNIFFPQHLFLLKTMSIKESNEPSSQLTTQHRNDFTVTFCFVIFITVTMYIMANTFVFSCLPQMVRSYGIAEENIGFYAGIIASSGYTGRLSCSILWGYLIDVKGKKFSSIMTQACLLVSTVLFGFSRSFSWASTTRFIQGCAKGQYIVALALVADACDSTNKAVGVSICIASHCLGVTFGPSLGGFLAFPNQRFPDVFGKIGLFKSFPILLPALVTGSGIFIGIVLTLMFIPSDGIDNKDNGYEVVRDREREREREIERERDFDIFDQLENPSSDTDYESDKDFSKKHALTSRPLKTLFEKLKQAKFLQIIRSRRYLVSCFLYVIIAFLEVGIMEVFPVYATTGPTYKGLGFSTAQTGVLLTVPSLLVLPIQLTVLPKLNNYYGSKKTYVMSCLSLAISCTLLPITGLIRQYYVLWACLVMIMGVIRIAIFSGFLSSTLLVNDAVDSNHRGSGNGFLMAIGAVGRLTSPLVFGGLFSWSLQNVKGIEQNPHALGFPFNQYLIFFFCSLFSLLGALLTLQLPVEVPKE